MTKRPMNKILTVALSVALVLAVAAGSTLAYVFVKTDALENLFRHSQVTCRVDADGQVFAVTNTGNIDAFIRAAVVVNWVDGEGNIRGVKPTADQYALEINGSAWYCLDGVYYCLGIVEPDENTPALITAVTVLEQPAGYQLQVEVAAEAIQAKGVNAAGQYAFLEAWNITVPGVQP